MSDLLDKAHADAVLGLLTRRAGPVPIAVYDGQVPNPYPDPAAHPWALVYFAPGWPIDGAANSLDGNAVTYVQRIYVHSTGASAAAARAVGGQVRAALLNIRPAVSGRIAWPIRRVDGNPPDRDETLGFLVMDQVDVYELKTAPG
jgi:hypothetical protein